MTSGNSVANHSGMQDGSTKSAETPTVSPLKVGYPCLYPKCNERFRFTLELVRHVEEKHTTPDVLRRMVIRDRNGNILALPPSCIYRYFPDVGLPPPQVQKTLELILTKEKVLDPLLCSIAQPPPRPPSSQEYPAAPLSSRCVSGSEEKYCNGYHSVNHWNQSMYRAPQQQQQYPNVSYGYQQPPPPQFVQYNQHPPNGPFGSVAAARSLPTPSLMELLRSGNGSINGGVRGVGTGYLGVQPGVSGPMGSAPYQSGPWSSGYDGSVNNYSPVNMMPTNTAVNYYNTYSPSSLPMNMNTSNSHFNPFHSTPYSGAPPLVPVVSTGSNSFSSFSNALNDTTTLMPSNDGHPHFIRAGGGTVQSQPTSAMLPVPYHPLFGQSGGAADNGYNAGVDGNGRAVSTVSTATSPMRFSPVLTSPILPFVTPAASPDSGRGSESSADDHGSQQSPMAGSGYAASSSVASGLSGQVQRSKRSLSVTSAGGVAEKETEMDSDDDSNDSWVQMEGFTMDNIVALSRSSAAKRPCRSSGSTNKMIPIADNDKPYICPVPGCSKSYKNMNGIKYHARSAHRTKKPYRCLCNKKYATEDKYLLHMALCQTTLPDTWLPSTSSTSSSSFPSVTVDQFADPETTSQSVSAQYIANSIPSTPSTASNTPTLESLLNKPMESPSHFTPLPSLPSVFRFAQSKATSEYSILNTLLDA